MKIHFGHHAGKYNPLYELHRNFCAEIGPLQLGVVLVFYILIITDGMIKIYLCFVNKTDTPSYTSVP